jgi:hypothetical protein
VRHRGTSNETFALVSETRRNAGDRGDGRRVAHNPEVEGSKSLPRYQGQRPSFEQEEGLWSEFCKLTL